ncbi:hypothetical protein FH972_021757 [Carpinus fangiana]|uniref:Rab-GAP TBC domain-containing protein n=1 Tax=Carpinus fangiana TaxID=176857 RepID=A0A5N6KQT5_9ROSI|nr:hypothetical protein FH972_021757 [Carpinus fangiana]
MVTNGHWQGPPAPPDHAHRPLANQTSLPSLRAPNDGRPPPPPSPSALRPRAPSSPGNQFFSVFPPRTSSNNRRANVPLPAPRPAPAPIAVPPPPRSASLRHLNNLRSPTAPHPSEFPPRKASVPQDQLRGVIVPPTRRSPALAEQPFAIAGTTPPPHLPLRKEATQNLRLGRPPPDRRLLQPRIRTDAFPQQVQRGLRPRSADLSPSSSPAQSPRLDVFPPHTNSSSSPPLDTTPAGLTPPQRPPQTPYPGSESYNSNLSNISLASDPAPRPPPAHQNYTVGTAFRSTSTPQPLAGSQSTRYNGVPPEANNDHSGRTKPDSAWQEQSGDSPVRESLHSALTNGSSAVDLSGTDRSSIITSRSSASDANQPSSNWPKIREQNAAGEEVISVDEYLDMYAEGFETSPAVTATDVDIPAVPPLPSLQKEPPSPSIVPPLEKHLSEEYPRADSPPPVPADVDIFKFEEPRQQDVPSTDLLKVEQPIAEMRRVESLMAEPPAEEPPSPEPSQAGFAHAVQPGPEQESSESRPPVPATMEFPPRKQSLPSDRLDAKLDTQPDTIVTTPTGGNSFNLGPVGTAVEPLFDGSKDEPTTRQENIAQEDQNESLHQIGQSPAELIQSAPSLEQEQQQRESINSLARTASLHSEPHELERWESLQPEPFQAMAPRADPPRVSSYGIGSPYEDDGSAAEKANPGPDKKMQPPRISTYGVGSPYDDETVQTQLQQPHADSNSLLPVKDGLPRPESSYDDPDTLQLSRSGFPPNERPVTAPNKADLPKIELSTIQEASNDARPFTAPRLEYPPAERPPLPQEPSSAQSSPVQSPKSAKFPSGSQASPVTSPRMHTIQPERGSMRPVPRARMMAPPTKVGAMKVGAMGPVGIPRTFAAGARTSAQIMAGLFDASEAPAPSEDELRSPHRDRYGFKKQSQYVKEEQYDAWNLYYAMYLERRRNKWNELMMSNGCSIDKPTVFPPKSDKVKRYVRKGIPPEWRGAAWFYYAGGPARVAKDPRLYLELATKGDRGDMSEQDREHIERDLNRTFPDNLKFKAEPPAEPSPNPRATMSGSMSTNRATMSTMSSGSRDSAPSELPMIRSLRRVLRAFAIHCPKIGYCQSLNFLAGQLLLFLDGDEEKAFHLLCVLTTEHLPGTHGFALEGANVDIGVLMQSLRDTMPQVWAQLDDRAGTAAKTGLGDMRTQTGLPTVSLATTAWFMSCFVGTLPIESACRVWDCLFYEGSKTLFRVALGIFRLGEPEIRRLGDPMEIFQVVQTLPRHLIDANALMEASFGKSLEGRGLLGQGVVERRRAERRIVYNAETIAQLQPPPMPEQEGDKDRKGLSRGMGTLRRLKSRKGRT